MNTHDNIYTIKINDEKDGHKLLNQIIKEKVVVNKFEILKPTLNDIFIEKVGDIDEWYKNSNDFYD